MNVSSGDTAELVRKALGEIKPFSLPEHGSGCPSNLISDSLKTCEIFTAKQTPGHKENHHMVIPSLQKTGTSEPMSEISCKDTCMVMSVSVEDSRTATEFSSVGKPLYSNSVSLLSNGEGTLDVPLNEHGITDL